MAEKAIVLKVIDAAGSESTVKVVPSLDGEPLRLQAEVGSKYIVMDETSKFAPKDINVHKSGQDLVLSFTDSENPDVIIEQYYSVKQGRDSVLLGQHENGQYYPFVPTSGQESETIYMLPEHSVSKQALGGDPVNIVTNVAASSVSDESALASTSFLSPTVSNSIYYVGAGLLGGAVGAYFARGKDKSSNDDTDILKDELNEEIDKLKEKIAKFDGIEEKLSALNGLNNKLVELQGKLEELEKKIDNLLPPDDPADPSDINTIDVVVNENSQIIGLHHNSRDEIVFKLLPEHKDKNFGGFDEVYISNFYFGNFNDKESDADRIVLKDLIIGDISPDSPPSELAKYFQIKETTYDVILNIDRDGEGTQFTIADSDVHISFLEPGAPFTLQELIANGQLVWM